MATTANELITIEFSAFARKCFASTHGQLLGKQSYVAYLCGVLARIARGEINRLIVNLPPRHLKSFLGSICLTAWWLAQRPSSRVIIVTYTEPLARNLGHQIQSIMRTPWYVKLFNTRISHKRSSATDFSTTQGGGLYAVSLGGSITGYGADLLIFDDPMNISDAGNEQQLQRVNDSFDPLIMSRLNHPKTDPVIIVAHRLAENDLSGFLLQQGGWEHVALPFIATQDMTYGSWSRGAGELLRPEAYSNLDVARIRASGAFDTLYQQCVGCNEHNIQPKDFPRFRGYELPTERAIVLSIDTSLCSGPRNSFSVIQAWWRSETNNYYLIDQWRKQCNYDELWAGFNSMCRKHNPCAAVIEKSANGHTLIRDARRRKSRIQVVEVSTGGRSKLDRLMTHLTIIREGRVRLPMAGDFLDDYLAELTASRRTDFDQIDATTQYLDWIKDQPALKPAAPRALAVVMNSRGQRTSPKTFFTGHNKQLQTRN